MFHLVYDTVIVAVLALYWTLLHHEEPVAMTFGDRYTLDNDIVIRKLQGNGCVLTSPNILSCYVAAYLLVLT